MKQIYKDLLYSTDQRGKLSRLSLLFFGTLHSNGYVVPCLLCVSLLFTAICKASSDGHFVFFAFLFLGDGLDYRLMYNVINLHP